MNRFVIAVVVMLIVAGMGCRKENKPGVISSPENVSEIAATSEDGDEISKTYAHDETNEFSEYSFSGVAGTYFGYRCEFKMHGDSKFVISFGTILTTSPSLTEADIMSLISPGEKSFGSLGSYTSYPKLIPNRVEIAYTDRHSKRWCSTKITEKTTDWGTDTNIEISQDGSTFEVEKVNDIFLSDGSRGYWLQGTFNCYLYEVNGKYRKKFKGNFSGVISARL